MEGTRNPELQRVLAALNSFSQYQQPQQDVSQSSSVHYSGHSYNQGQYTNSSTTTNIPGLGLLQEPNTYGRPITPPVVNRENLHPNHPQRSGRISTPQPPAQPIRSGTSTPKYDVPDASGIITWPAALKHVTRHLVPNEKVANRVKHLINTQHKHEQEWWDGRQAIMDRQEGKSSTSDQVSAILKSLGAPVNAARDPRKRPAPDPVRKRREDEAELKAYDEKVYKALTAMTADFDRQLREMGVPFYAIKYDLVILKDGPEKYLGEHKGKIDKGELRELQKRMCETLEDLFGDDKKED